jgi:predicted GNAT family acetyltransferase
VTDASSARVSLRHDPQAKVYEAVLDGEVVGGIAYDVEANRVSLLTTTVTPALQGRGIASAMIRLTLDAIRRDGHTVTIICPVVRSFIERHPDYENVIDAGHPGVKSTSSARRPPRR